MGTFDLLLVKGLEFYYMLAYKSEKSIASWHLGDLFIYSYKSRQDLDIRGFITHTKMHKLLTKLYQHWDCLKVHYNETTDFITDSRV